MTVADVIDAVVREAQRERDSSISAKLARHLRATLRTSIGDAGAAVVTPERLGATRSFCFGFIAGYLERRVN